SCGGSSTFTFVADPGYHISQVLIDGTNDPTAVSSGTYTFLDVQANHTIHVEFVSDCSPTTLTIVTNEGSFCGNLTLTAVPADPPVVAYTYEWRLNGGPVFSTSQTITLTLASPTGTYSVTATESTCTTPPAYFTYSSTTRQNTLQSYTVLSTDDVDFGE